MKIFIISILTLFLFSFYIRTKTESHNSGDNESFKNLINDKDTLIVVINISGSLSRRNDIIRFVKIDNDLYFKTEIKDDSFNLDTMTGLIKYDLSPIDSISFDFLLSNAKPFKIDSTDSLKSHRFLMSIGVSQKQSEIYAIDKNDDKTQSDFINLYMSIMSRFHPEMKQYKTLSRFEIINDKIEK